MSTVPATATLTAVARPARTVSLHRAERLAAAHTTTVARLFVDYPPLLSAVDGERDDDTARVPLSMLVTALGY